MKKPPAVKQGVLGVLVLVQCGVGYWQTRMYSGEIWTRVWVRVVLYTHVP